MRAFDANFCWSKFPTLSETALNCSWGTIRDNSPFHIFILWTPFCIADRLITSPNSSSSLPKVTLPKVNLQIYGSLSLVFRQLSCVGATSPVTGPCHTCHSLSLFSWELQPSQKDQTPMTRTPTAKLQMLFIYLFAHSFYKHLSNATIIQAAR